MRKILKILHTLASCGLIGALLGYMLLLLYAPQDTPQQYADMRHVIDVLTDYVLVPSMGVAVVTGLFAMAAHPPFLERRWVWLKALMGLGLFEGTFSLSGSKADYAARLAEEMAAGTAAPDALDVALAGEWTTLWVLMALSVAQVVVGVWRPSLRKRPRPPAPAPTMSENVDGDRAA